MCKCLLTLCAEGVISEFVCVFSGDICPEIFERQRNWWRRIKEEFQESLIYLPQNLESLWLTLLLVPMVQLK